MRTAAHLRPYRRQRGVTLVELMVGLTIGLIIALAIVAAGSTFNLQRRITVSGNDARENGLATLTLLERAARQAGVGLFHNGQTLCTSLNIYFGGTTVANGATLAPLKITDGGGTGSDTISVVYGNPVGGSADVTLVTDMPNPSSVFTVNHQGTLQTHDLAVVGVPGSGRPCTLFEVTGFNPGGGGCGGVTTSCIDILHNQGQSTYNANPPNPNNAFADAPTYGYVNNPPGVIGPAVITRMGSFVQESYRVMCNSLVVVNDLTAAANAPSCTASPLAFTNATPLAGDIVQIQAQYGISAAANSDIVASWVDATGSWANPGAASVALIKAIRVVVVARSKEPAVSDVSAPCTNAAGIANTGPCSFHDASAPVINLSAVTVPAGMTWRRYRYYVYQSVTPLRNVTWND